MGENSIVFKMFTVRNFTCFRYLGQHYGI